MRFGPRRHKLTQPGSAVFTLGDPNRRPPYPERVLIVVKPAWLSACRWKSSLSRLNQLVSLSKSTDGDGRRHPVGIRRSPKQMELACGSARLAHVLQLIVPDSVCGMPNEIDGIEAIDEGTASGG